MSRRSQRVLVGVGVILAVAAAGVVVPAWLSSGGGSAVGTGRLVPAASSRTPSPPPRGALLLAGEAGSRAVALAVEQGSRPRLTATVLSGSGDAESGLSVSFRVGATLLRARSCGPGCYRAGAPARARRVEVLLPGGPVLFRLPVATSPAAGIVKRATRVFNRLSSLVYVESLRSGPTGGLLTTWRLVAPDRLSYQIRGGAAAVVIGRRRWDQNSPGGSWVRSSQIPALQVPQPTWDGVTTNARLLGTSRVGGHSVWIVSFANPTIPAWFTAWIDRRSYRTLQLRMTAAAHFMFHRYVAFDRPVRIEPPKR